MAVPVDPIVSGVFLAAGLIKWRVSPVRPVFLAAEAGNLPRVQALLAALAPDNVHALTNRTGQSLYDVAAEKGHTGIMAWLAEQPWFFAPFSGHRALKAGHLHVFAMWLHHGGSLSFGTLEDAQGPHCTAVAEALSATPHRRIALAALRRGHLPHFAGAAPATIDAVNHFMHTADKAAVSEEDLAAAVTSMAQDAAQPVLMGAVDADTVRNNLTAAHQVEMGAAAAHLTAAQAERDEAQVQLQQTQAERDEARVRLAAAETERNQAHAQLHQARTELDEARAQLQQARTERDEARVQLAAADTNHAAAVDQLHQAQRQFEDDRRNLQLEITTLREALTREAATAAARIQDLEKAATDLRTELDGCNKTWRSVVDRNERQLRAAETKEAKSHGDLTATNTALEAARRESEAVQQQLDTAQHQAAAVRYELQLSQEQSAVAVRDLRLCETGLAAWNATARASLQYLCDGPAPEAVAAIVRGLGDPNTVKHAALLLHPLFLEAPDMVTTAITATSDVVCDAVVLLLRGNNAAQACPEAGLLAWLVAQAHKAAPGAPWPRLPSMIGALHGVVKGTVEYDDYQSVQEAARRNMSCELGSALGSSALLDLLDRCSSAKFRLLGFLSEYDALIRGGVPFYDAGRCSELKDGPALWEKAHRGREVIVVDPATDATLVAIMEEARAVLSAVTGTLDKANALAEFVHGMLGGVADVGFEARVAAAVARLCERNSRLDLGGLGVGLCRHRAILYKLLADMPEANIPCRLMRGKVLKDGAWLDHAWNVVCSEPTSAEEAVQYLLVDLMRTHTAVPIDSAVGAQYRRYRGADDVTIGAATLFGGAEVLDGSALTEDRLIGRGSFGNVYQYRDKLAVKAVLISDRNPKHKAAREHQVMAESRHPSLMPLKGYHVTDNRVFLMMPLGIGSLQKFHELAPGASNSVVLLGVAQGMANLHGRRRHVTHRDLKPANVILVSHTDGKVLPKITDFGAAKMSYLGGSMSASTKVCTAGYAAPEQRWDWEKFYNPAKIGRPCDVFAFGQMLGFLYTSDEPPKQRPPQHVYDLTPIAMPETLKNLYRWCTALDPDGRPTFEDIVEALETQVRKELVQKLLRLWK